MAEVDLPTAAVISVYQMSQKLCEVKCDFVILMIRKVRSLNMIGLYAGFLNTSNCLTLLISLERCFLVISPLKARDIMSTR